MEITIAIITRNRAPSLFRCLSSITKQTKQPDKVIIVDNNSTDNTRAVTNSFKQNLPIHYFVEKRIGFGFARNAALKKIKEGILAFTDDDCIAPRDWIKNILKYHSKYPDVAVIQGWSISYPKSNPISVVAQAIYREGYMSSSFNENNILVTDKNFLRKDWKFLFFDTKNASLKIEVLKKNKLKFNNNLKRWEEVELSKKLLLLGEQIMFCPQIKIYHLELRQINKFLRKRFIAGYARRQILSNKEFFFPNKGKFWLVRRIVNFMRYCIKNYPMRNFFVYLCIYLLDKTAIAFGYLYGVLKLSDNWNNNHIGIKFSKN